MNQPNTTPPTDWSVDLASAVAESDGDLPPPDDLFRALANSKRRRLLSVLSAESSMSLDELTDILVGWECTIDGPAGPDERAQVKIELVHAHLPLLEDAGLVTVEDRTVRRAALADPVEGVIDFAGEYEDATNEHGTH